MTLYLGIVLLIVFLTRVIAYWGVGFLKGDAITLIPNWLYFTYVENTGAAFGIFRDAKWLLIALAVALFVGITYYVASQRHSIKKSMILPLSMIAGGGISNVADRMQFGFVVDYIDFRIIDYPVFNLADICVVLGVCWLFLMIWKMPSSQEK